MQWTLVAAGFAMGMAATPHCAVMCGAPCAAMTRSGLDAMGGFHLGRLVGYAAAGAVAAGSVAALAEWSQASPALRPFWTLLHLAFLGLGLWWMFTGRQPAWMLNRSGTEVQVKFQGRSRPAARATLAGLAWVAWPCAALQGGLLLAALANDARGGALVMAAFALGSMPGLAVAPWAWSRWHRWRGNTLPAGQVATLAFRVAGAGLVVVSGWALTHGIREHIAAWCAA